MTTQVHRPKTAYLEARLREIGLTLADATRYGLSADPRGNILQHVRTFGGDPVMYLPAENKHKAARIADRRGTFAEHVESLYRPHVVKRLHPDYLAQNPNLPKYLGPKDVTPRPMPTPAAIEAFRAGRTGGTVVFVEGYLKAAALAAQGIEAVAFTGISVYKVCEQLREYLEARRPDGILILYDGDALEVKPKPGQVTSSRRPADFYNSAARFAGQLFDLAGQLEGWKTAVTWCMVKPDAAGKGVDDLLAAADPAAVIDDLLATDPAGPYFDKLRLRKTRYQADLKAVFGLSNYRKFYRRHADKIGGGRFRYRGAAYQATSNGADLWSDPARQFTLLTDPFAVDLPAKQIIVNRYLSEASAEIDAELATWPRLAIGAPTGSGKTSFFLKYTKRTGQRVVIAVPTRALCKQQKRPGVYCLYGHATPVKIEAALNSPVIACTYDTLHHVADLADRVLVVDEAHNLVNQFGEVRRGWKPFRADVLRRVVEAFDEARQTVCISGTMSKLLCKAFDLHLVEVRRKENHQVKVTAIEADRSGRKSLQAALYMKLAGLDYSSGAANFVYYNNREALEDARQYAIGNGWVTAEQVEVITRPHYDGGEDRVLNEITRHERIKSDVRLILCTCILSEGVNIKNRNIGELVTVGLRDPDDLRQFAARFREMATLNVTCILPAEGDLKDGFLYPADLELAGAFKYAELEAEEYERARRYFAAEDFDDAELPYLDRIEAANAYRYRPDVLPLIYTDDHGHARPDVLRILAGIKHRQIETGNNCYFYSRLQAAGFALQSAQAAEPDPEAVEHIETRSEAKKTALRENLDKLRADLEQRPGVVLAALREHYQRTNNRHGGPFLDIAAGGLIEQANAVEAVVYLENSAEIFADKKCRRLIRDFARLIFAGMDPAEASAELADYRPGKFAEAWRILETQLGLSAYENRHYRRQLSTLHKFDLKAKIWIRNEIDAELATTGSDEIPEARAVAIIRRLFQRRTWPADLAAEVVEQITNVTPADAARYIRELYDAELVTFHSRKVYRIRQKWQLEKLPFLTDRPLPITRKPLQILELWRE